MVRVILAAAVGLVLAAVLFRLAVAASGAGKVTSWWRSPDRNRRVGGKPWSLHQLGLAVDVLPTPANRAALARLRALIPFSVVVDEGDHLHFQVA